MLFLFVSIYESIKQSHSSIVSLSINKVKIYFKNHNYRAHNEEIFYRVHIDAIYFWMPES